MLYFWLIVIFHLTQVTFVVQADCKTKQTRIFIRYHRNHEKLIAKYTAQTGIPRKQLQLCYEPRI